jgi:hypothetical protein
MHYPGCRSRPFRKTSPHEEKSHEVSHPILYFEIAGNNGKRLQEFYASVFD